MTKYNKIIDLFLDDKEEFTCIHGGGSDRVYWRYNGQGESPLILVKYNEPAEMNDFILLTGILKKNNVNVQDIYEVDKKNSIIIIEDLGDTSLYRVFHTYSNYTGIYKECVLLLAAMQHKCEIDFTKSSAYKIFDYNKFLFEQNYFLERFVSEYCDKKKLITRKIKEDCKKLSEYLVGLPKKFMHRDFQSQNIFIKNESIYFIDYQTAHIGTIYYDLASLLKDPYTDIKSHDEENLLYEYYNAAVDFYGYNLDVRTFFYHYMVVSFQRLMQTLGAYSFLSMHKQKKHFQQYIQPALNKLRETSKELNDYLYLIDLINSL